MKKILKVLMIIAVVLWIIMIVMAVQDSNASGNSVPVEQNCQYPGRVYEDGTCNNSDPCDPETLKDPVLQGDCRPVEQKAETPVQVPVVEQTPQAPTVTNNCGGK